MSRRHRVEYYNVARLNYVSSRICVARHSAGGHLTAMALLTAAKDFSRALKILIKSRMRLSR